METGKIVICLEGVKDSPYEGVKDSPSEGFQLGILEEDKTETGASAAGRFAGSWRKSKKRSRKRNPLMPERNGQEPSEVGGSC